MRTSAPRLVLDLNVVVSGLLAERAGAATPPAQCLAAVRQGAAQLCLSAGLLARLRGVLGYAKLGFDASAIDAISHEIAEWVPRDGWVADPPAPPAGHALTSLCPDPEDDTVLRVALAARARFLVTGDAHLLQQLTPEGARLVRKTSLAILTAREFLDQLPRGP